MLEPWLHPQKEWACLRNQLSVFVLLPCVGIIIFGGSGGNYVHLTVDLSWSERPIVSTKPNGATIVRAQDYNCVVTQRWPGSRDEHDIRTKNKYWPINGLELRAMLNLTWHFSPDYQCSCPIPQPCHRIVFAIGEEYDHTQCPNLAPFAEVSARHCSSHKGTGVGPSHLPPYEASFCWLLHLLWPE